jgi:hypothetical protein
MEKILIDEKAKELILAKKGSAITIKLEKYGGGWAGCTYMPAVYVGAPADRGEYEKVLVDDIEVYISKFIDLSQGLKIVTSGFAMFKGLAVVPLR